MKSEAWQCVSTLTQGSYKVSVRQFRKSQATIVEELVYYLQDTSVSEEIDNGRRKTRSYFNQG